MAIYPILSDWDYVRTNAVRVYGDREHWRYIYGGNGELLATRGDAENFVRRMWAQYPSHFQQTVIGTGHTIDQLIDHARQKPERAENPLRHGVGVVVLRLHGRHDAAQRRVWRDALAQWSRRPRRRRRLRGRVVERVRRPAPPQNQRCPIHEVGAVALGRLQPQDRGDRQISAFRLPRLGAVVFSSTLTPPGVGAFFVALAGIKKIR